MKEYCRIPLANIQHISDSDPGSDWDKFDDWCYDRFENKWTVLSTKQGLVLKLYDEFDLTEFKLTWL